MPKELLSRVKESAFSIGPVFLVILALNFSGFFMMDSNISASNVSTYISVFTSGFYSDYYVSYLFGPVLLCFLLAFLPLVLGLSLFGMGADQAMNKMGALVGASLTKKKSVWLLAIVSFLLGTLVTLAEPDLSVFSTQLFGESGKWIMMVVVSLGLGLLLALALVRILLGVDYRMLVFLIFMIVFGLGTLASDDSVFPVVADGVGTTTGAVSAPFILALGIGVAQAKGGKNAEDDSFGVSGMASLGPFISIMIMAEVMPDFTYSIDAGNAINSYSQLPGLYSSYALSELLDVTLSMAPLVLFFIIYKFIFLKDLSNKEMLKIALGLAYTFVGLYVFLLAADTGLIPVGRKMGLAFGSPNFQENFWAVALVCLGIGLLLILAEPAVHVLGKQVEEVSRGSIRSRELMVALCVAMALAVLFGILRVKYRIPIMDIMVPIILLVGAMSLFVPEIYTALAFDSAGIASGTMTSCFLLPMCLGMAVAVFGADDTTDIVKYGSGILGLVSTTPLLAIEALGVYGRIKSIIAIRITRSRIREPDDEQVVHLVNGEPFAKEVTGDVR